MARMLTYDFRPRANPLPRCRSCGCRAPAREACLVCGASATFPKAPAVTASSAYVPLARWERSHHPRPRQDRTPLTQKLPAIAIGWPEVIR